MTEFAVKTLSRQSNKLYRDKQDFFATEFVAKTICDKIWVLSQESLVTSSVVTKFGFVMTEFAAKSVAIKSGLSRLSLLLKLCCDKNY